MHRVTYLSAATAPLDAAGLQALLTVSRRNNARLGITGMMLYHDGSFLQILEGPEDAVNGLYDRISQDSRHGGMIRMLAAPVTTRAFPDWQMGLVQLSELDPGQRDGVLSLIALARGEGGAMSEALERDRMAGILVRSFLRGLREFDGRLGSQDIASSAQVTGEAR